MSSAIAIIAALAVTLLLGGCSLYHHAFPDSHATQPGYDLEIVQLDDFGSFWEPSRARATLAKVEAQSQSRSESAYVVVFIHGWHNNAAPDNANLQEFNQWLGKLATELGQPARAAARQDLTGSPAFTLVGIYVGWRGRALPGVLDYGTMWWRKSAAERVGDGDLSEFLERLQRMYLRANSLTRYAEDPAHTTFTGLFTIGHSFGGQVLLKAIARPLEAELAMRAPSLTDALEPAPTRPTPTLERVPIDSFGDLNILVNPATEAYQFARIDGLYRQLAYSSQQTPQLVVFSADNDVPRQSFFPIARALTRPFRPKLRNPYQGALWGKALGELTDQQTHSLADDKMAPDSLTDEDFTPENRHKVADFDFSSDTVFSKVRLSRLPGRAAIANSPVLVIYTHDKIIDGHNGVFDPKFMAFLPQYIAYIEGKRIVQRYQRFRQTPAYANPASPALADASSAQN